MSNRIAHFLGYLGSGELVIDRPRNSHVQSHKLPDGLLVRALAMMDSGSSEHLVGEATFPDVVGLCTCVETTDDDDVVWARRLHRGGLTRFVRGREGTPSKSVAVILNRHGYIDGVPAYRAVTAYVGKKGHPEPGDWHAISRESNALQASLHAFQYWSNHALVWGCEPVYPGSVTTRCPWSDYV